MRISFHAALLAASMLALPAFAQSPPGTVPPVIPGTPPATVVPAPPPSAPIPAAGMPGAPVGPLTASDTAFVRNQLEENATEIAAAQMALQHSQDQNVRNFAEKMINDHTYADNMLLPIAQPRGIQTPTVLNPEHQAMLDSWAHLEGPAFDRAYIDAVVRWHGAMINQLNDQIANGQSQQINAWAVNTKPIVQQHYQIGLQLAASLPRAG